MCSCRSRFQGLRFFFFQAEDGIRDWSVTGVQTCALPILLCKDLAVVVLDWVAGDDLRAEHLLQLHPFIGTVQTRGDKDEDVASGETLLLERPQERRQDQPVG